MSNVPTNLIPSRITQLPEYTGTSTDGYFPYDYGGRTYKVQFGQLAAAGAVPATREINTGNGLTGGGNLTQNRTISIANGGVGSLQLDQTGVVAGTYGDADKVAQFTVDANGRISSVTDVPIVLSAYVPITRSVLAGTGLTGGGTLNADRTFNIDFSSATPEPLGVPTAGVGTKAAREDHVHPAVDLSDTAETQGTLPLARGGTGNSLSPVAGAVVYSDGSNFELTNPGNAGEVLVSNGAGQPYWSALVGSGTVTSVGVSGGTTGFSFSNSPITTSGTMTMSGTLGVANGGTGLTATPTNGQLLIGNGTGYTLAALTAGANISVTGGAGSISIAVTGTVPSATNVAGGSANQIVYQTGAGATSFITAPTVANTYLEWSGSAFQWSANPLGTVTSVDVSGGTTGLTTSGGPIISSGTITLAGTLNVANGGTGLTTAPSNGQLLIGNGTGYTLATLTDGTAISITEAAGAITITNTAPDQIVSLTGGGTTSISGTYPNFTITSNDQYVGTVTSVAALTLTSNAGSDLSSTVANSTTTPVITLNVPNASATQRGALTSTDWSTFNGKQDALVSGVNIKTVGGNSLLGAGDVGTIGTGYGGTGLSSYTAGDLPYYATGTALSKLAIGALNTVLTSSGTAPQWSSDLTIGKLTATLDSVFSSTGALQISKGTTGEQPGSPATGMIRYNTSTNQFEGYSGASPAWKSIGGSALSNDTSTASNLYPVFAGATTGTAENLYTSNAKLLYKPSTGELAASAPVASNGIFVNNATVNDSYTIASGQNGFSVGPMTIASGVTVTVTTGQIWVVI